MRFFWLIGALLFFPTIGHAQNVGVPFTPCATSVTINATSVSSNAALSCQGTQVKIINIGSTEAFIKIGSSSTITAATTDDSIPGGACGIYDMAPTGFVAGITASLTTTLRVTQGWGVPHC